MTITLEGVKTLFIILNPIFMLGLAFWLTGARVKKEAHAKAGVDLALAIAAALNHADHQQRITPLLGHARILFSRERDVTAAIDTLHDYTVKVDQRRASPNAHSDGEFILTKEEKQQLIDDEDTRKADLLKAAIVAILIATGCSKPAAEQTVSKTFKAKL